MAGMAQPAWKGSARHSHLNRTTGYLYNELYNVKQVQVLSFSAFGERFPAKQNGQVTTRFIGVIPDAMEESVILPWYAPHVLSRGMHHTS